MLNMYKQITIKTLKNQGQKNAGIARQIGCHRNTVRNILQRKKLILKQARDRSSYFNSLRDKIEKLLDKKISRLRVYEILQEEYGINRTYDSLCKYVQREFPKKPQAYGVQIVSPGEEAEMDFGYAGMLPDYEGRLSKTWVFIMTMSWSRNGYYQFTNDQKVVTLMKAFVRGFEFFGGVPKKVKVDNLKAAISKNQHYDLVFNQDFLEFAHHYGFVIKPCPPYRPEQKGKVEAGVKYAEINFLAGRKFKEGVDKDNQLYSWMVNYANKRIHGTTKKVPAEEFEKIEKKCLQPLPENTFAFFQRGVRKVKANCHINFENNYYSVPSLLVGKQITIRWDEHILRVICQGEQEAIHRLVNDKKGKYITVRSHLPDCKCFSETEYQAKYEQKMIEIGSFAHQYFKKVLIEKDSYWFKSIRSILGLVKTYGNKTVNLSLKRALYFGVTNMSVIRNICEKKLYLFDQEPKLIKTSFSNGSDRTEGIERDLSYYQLALRKENTNYQACPESYRGRSRIYQFVKKLERKFKDG